MTGQGRLSVMQAAFVTLLCAPVYLAQALTTIARTERLPEAAGPRAGEIGQGALLRLLVLGDSSAAGVGVTHQDQALVGQMLAHLAPHHCVTWELRARSGVTTYGARRSLLAGAAPCDVAVLALGVNDVLRETRADSFARAYAALLQDLRQHHGARVILASAVPPLGLFPAFPEPWRSHLGRRAALLDARLQDLCARTGVEYVPFDLTPNTDLLARDGFHPGAPIYAEWGARMAGLALRALS